MTAKGLGRHAAADERDENFLLLELSGTVGIESLREYRYYNSPYCLDQGNVPQCVGYSTKTMLLNGPIRQIGTEPTPQQLYDFAQRNDEWDGEDYGGTSVRAGMKAAVHYGTVSEYRWAFTLEDTIRWLLLGNGPLVVGTNWYSGMSNPKDDWMYPNGIYQGGHAYGIIGANRVQKKVRVLNNWGRDWSDDGRAWLSFDALDYLIKSQGEVACAVEVQR